MRVWHGYCLWCIQGHSWVLMPGMAHQERMPGSPGPPLLCKECSKHFFTQHKYGAHLCDIHGHQFQCTICGQHCGSNETFGNHMCLHSTQQWPHQCPECNAWFAYPSLLRHHMETHAEAEFPCIHVSCGCIFHRMCNMVMHAKSHDSHVYLCPFRSEGCMYSSTLFVSVTTHMAEKHHKHPHFFCHCGWTGNWHAQHDRHAHHCDRYEEGWEPPDWSFYDCQSIMLQSLLEWCSFLCSTCIYRSDVFLCLAFLVVLTWVMSLVYISVFARVSSFLLVFVSVFMSLLMSLLGNNLICVSIFDLWW